jgi:hypothetical protein
LTSSTHATLTELAATRVLGDLLAQLAARWGRYELLHHWTQGEFHHDLVLRIPAAPPVLPGEVLVVATNCNGGVKEVLCLAQPPERMGLWHARCPDNADFSGNKPQVLASAITEHWFDPCELLRPDARSELREEFRERQCGGGWKLRGERA